MNHLIPKLILYRNLPDDGILSNMVEICKRAEQFDSAEKDELIGLVLSQINKLLRIATDYAFDGNLWQNYLTFVLITNENPFSLTAEKVGAKEGSVNGFAKQDFALFREMFHYDFSRLEKLLDIDCFSVITNYKAIEKPELMYNKNVSARVRELSKTLSLAPDTDAFYEAVTAFYREYGVGMFGLNKAFRISQNTDTTIAFQPINNMEQVVLSDLIGYEEQKRQLVENTKAFVEGRKANNVLLFGDSGTGKSTSIKAIVNEFYRDGLRMIEIYKHQFKNLSDIIATVKNRNYKFIIYMDDLSFEEFEIEYKFLKAVIEGGVETKPENILIYATSNRRHLIKETWSDRNDMEVSEDLHRSDTMEEKLSLVNRFGVTICYLKPGRQEFLDMVAALAEKAGLSIPREKLDLEANRWELRHGGISGRTAQQFINHLLSAQNN